MKRIILSGILLVLYSLQFAMAGNIKDSAQINKALNSTQKAIVTIAALTAKGDLMQLQKALNYGLDAGLTVNQTKEVLVHLYAYCGFPRSIRGLQTFMSVLKQREVKGIHNVPGTTASPINDKRNKYQRGKDILSELTGSAQAETPSGYAAFSPIIDTFLKEHLFADVFERDILTYAQRELVTVSVLTAIGGVEPMLKSHLGICLHVGITPEQLQQFITVIQPSIGKKETAVASLVLNDVIKSASQTKENADKE